MNDIIKNYKHILFEKYAAFEGRSARPEFWYFVLANIIISFVLGLIEGIVSAPSMRHDDSVLGNIYSLLVLVPSIAVGIRRMHDIDRSGWWILFPLYNIYLAAQPGTAGANRFDTTIATTAEPTPIPAATPAPDQPQQ